MDPLRVAVGGRLRGREPVCVGHYILHEPSRGRRDALRKEWGKSQRLDRVHTKDKQELACETLHFVDPPSVAEWTGPAGESGGLQRGVCGKEGRRTEERVNWHGEPSNSKKSPMNRQALACETVHFMNPLSVAE